MSLATLLFLALFTINLTEGMEAPDFYENFIKVAGDDCANEDCTKTKYEPINDLNDFSQSYDLLNYIPYINQDNKRKDATQMDFFSGCGCHSKNELHDLGHTSYPRYINTAVCHKPESKHPKCWTGSKCKEIKYTVRVLRNRFPYENLDDQIPVTLQNDWKFERKIISVGCQCSIN